MTDELSYEPIHEPIKEFGKEKGIKKYMPRTLFARSLLILITPIVLTHIISTYVFFDRHWDRMAGRLSAAVAGEVAFVTRQVERDQSRDMMAQLTRDSLKTLQLSVQIIKDETIPTQKDHTHWRENFIFKVLSNELKTRIDNPFRIVVDAQEKWIQVQVQLGGDILMVTSPENRLFSSSGYVFLIWMMGVSAIMMVVAILFMRNQVRPIKKLAVAADWFGKGRDVPFFKPQGAREVRQAARAFIGMKERLNKQIQQRTEMLAGVSHDLRTPLTRMKLQLSLMEKNEDTQALSSDLRDMEKMMNAYLEFAKGEGDEPSENTDLIPFIQMIIHRCHHEHCTVNFNQEEGRYFCFLKPISFERCITNILNNAQKYAHVIDINIADDDDIIIITIDDDGPGIHPDHYDDVFKPFYREDTSRNTKTGGTGLGLSIAQNIILAHGGDIALDKSPQGGLRVKIQLPR